MTRFDPGLRLSSPRLSLPLRVRALSWTAWTLGIALLGIAAPAGAAFFSAETHVLTARSSEGNASAGAEPVILNFGPSSAPDGSATGRVSGTASNGLLFASGASSSAGVKITSLGLVSATYDDVLFIYTGVEPGPAFVEIGALNYEITVFMQTQGNLGTLGGFNGREVNDSVAFNGNADGGTIRWDVSGDAGQSLIGTHKLTSSLIPVDTPITVHLEMNAGAQASLRQPGSPVTTSIAGILQIGSFDVIPTASRASLVWSVVRTDRPLWPRVRPPARLHGAFRFNGDRRQPTCRSRAVRRFPLPVRRPRDRPRRPDSHESACMSILPTDRRDR